LGGQDYRLLLLVMFKWLAVAVVAVQLQILHQALAVALAVI
jgi:hypothetical protein